MMGKRKEIPTIWEVPDSLWQKIEYVLKERDPPKVEGRRRANQRAILNGIIFRLRSGCQWNRLPSCFGDDSTIHRTFQKWVELGVLARVWEMLVAECTELNAVNWEWQAADTAFAKARLGGMPSGEIPPTGVRPVPKGVSWWKGAADP